MVPNELILKNLPSGAPGLPLQQHDLVGRDVRRRQGQPDAADPRAQIRAVR
jgi:hypothetical protein